MVMLMMASVETILVMVTEIMAIMGELSEIFPLFVLNLENEFRMVLSY